ncbi:MAG: trypsin-like peptidase domain-containing protein [Alphaproteobacteria bacterium]
MYLVAAPRVEARAACDAPKPVCDARGAVFGISAFDPVGSAVRIAPDLLVTNRHIVADQTRAQIILPGGSKVEGEVIPASFLGDLVLVRAKLPDGPVFKIATQEQSDLWSLGQDISARKIKVYPKGKLLLAPFKGKPYARLHHTAYNQPGNSGGALVNASGELVGITASGGAGRFEAVPAAQIADLQKMSGPAHAEKSKSIGKNVRECTLMLEKARRLGDTLPEKIAGVVKTSCGLSENRQLFDLAGQLFGRQRRLDEAVEFFERSLDKDPNAINSRLGLVITLRFARKLDAAKPHVRWLLDMIPQERSIHPIALHIGKVSKDQALIDEALGLIEKHAPNQLEAAKNFLKSPVR